MLFEHLEWKFRIPNGCHLTNFLSKTQLYEGAAGEPHRN
jgi:hypothetical protein